MGAGGLPDTRCISISGGHPAGIRRVSRGHTEAESKRDWEFGEFSAGEKCCHIWQHFCKKRVTSSCQKEPVRTARGIALVPPINKDNGSSPAATFASIRVHWRFPSPVLGLGLQSRRLFGSMRPCRQRIQVQNPGHIGVYSRRRIGVWFSLQVLSENLLLRWRYFHMLQGILYENTLLHSWHCFDGFRRHRHGGSHESPDH
jgi:hypothetical protein